jgi:ferredoxin, 2Fe-2S
MQEPSVAKIRFIEHSGKEHVIDAPNGGSVMNAAIDHLVPGIDADCGGECSCATCHVIVDDKWIGVVGRPSDQEESMLDMNPEREVNSRLSCQIKVRDELDGLIVKLPQFQI